MDSSVWLLEETKVALNVRTTIKKKKIRSVGTIKRHKRGTAYHSRAAAMSANPL